MKNQNFGMVKRAWQQVVLGASLMLVAVAVHSQSAIEAVTGSIQGGVEVVKIDLTQPLAAIPTGFSIQSPARIALDFPGI